MGGDEFIRLKWNALPVWETHAARNHRIGDGKVRVLSFAFEHEGGLTLLALVKAVFAVR